MSKINRRFLPLLAIALLIASCFGFSNANADGPSISTEVEGFHGVYSFASFNGTANFSLTITNDGTTDFSDLAITTIFPDDTWEAEYATFSHSGETSVGGISIDGLVKDAIIKVDVHIFVGEDVDIPMTNEVYVKFKIDADNTIFESPDVTLVVSNWIAYQSPSLPDTKTYSVGDSFDYQILIKNIAVEMNDDGSSTTPVDVANQITIQPGTAGYGWAYSSNDPEWDFNSAVFDGLDAGVMRTLNITVTLVSTHVLAGDTVLELQASSTDPDDPWGVPYTQPFGMLTIPVTVAEAFGLSLSGGGTEEVDVSSGSSVASWVVQVNNLGNTIDDFSITWSVETIPAGWEPPLLVTSGTTITNKISASSSDSFNLVLDIPSDASAGQTAKFTMTAVSNGDNTLSVEQNFTAVVVQHYGVSLSVDNNTKNEKPGESVDFIFNVTNTGNGLDTFNITVEGPNTWTPSLSNDHVNVSAVSSGQFVLTVTIPADKEAGADSGNISVTVVSSDGETSANSIVSVSTQQVFDINLAYGSGSNGTLVIKQEQGLKFLLNVTNNGNGPDTLTFSLANAPSWAELRISEPPPIGRNSTYVAIIDLSPDSAALSGRDYTFQVIAKSSDGKEWTSPNFKVDIETKIATEEGGEVTVEKLEEEDSSLPGFGLMSSLLSLTILVLIRRRV